MKTIVTLLILTFNGVLAPAYAQSVPPVGEFGIGFETYDADSSEASELLTHLWYPTARNAVGESAVYPWGSWLYESPFIGVTDSEHVADGRFPIIVLSHGGGGWGGQFAYLSEALASHGFVVAAPTHSTTDLSIRATELSTVVDSVIARSAGPADKLYHKIDSESIALGGGSRGTATVAKALQQEVIDVDALLLLEATTMVREGLSVDLDVPVLHIGGGSIQYQSVLPLVSSSNFYALDIGAANGQANAHHWSFGVNGCQVREKVLEAGLAAGATEREILASVQPDSFWLGCNPELIPVDEVQRRVNSQSIGFLNASLEGGTGFNELLTPGMGSTDVDLQLRFSMNSASARSRATGLLTAPDGRQLGVSPVSGEPIDDFDGDASGNASRARRSLRWNLPSEILVPGEFVLTAVDATLESPQEYSIYQGTALDREDDIVYYELKQATGILAPNGEIEPHRFTLVPEPDSHALVLLVIIAHLFRSARITHRGLEPEGRRNM